MINIVKIFNLNQIIPKLRNIVLSICNLIVKYDILMAKKHF